MKKALSLFLSLVLVIGLIPVAAMSVSAEAIEPATSNTVTVSTADAFIALLGDGKTAESTKYVLTADIDLGGKDVTATPFILKNSVFDGGDHTVTGFTFSNYNDGTTTVWASVGLFQTSGKACIKNLEIGTSANMIVAEYAANYSASGILVGTVPSGAELQISNVSIWGKLSQTAGKTGAWNKKVGMFIGDASGSVTLSNCVSNGVINAQSNGGSHGAGGFIGFTGEPSKIEFDKCTNNTNVEATISNSKKHGGFVGSMHSDYFKATNCTNNGDLLTTDKAASATVQEIGGLIGDTWGTNTTARQIIVEGFENNGDISGTSFLGAVIGCNNIGSRSDDTVTITNSKNYGSVTATNGHAGGAIGVASAAKGTITVSDYYNAGNVTSTSSAGGVIGISEPSGDNNEQTIDIDRLINTGDIKGKWRGCAATGYVKNAKVCIDNCVTTGELIKLNNSSTSYAFTEVAADNTKVTGSGNYAVNGLTIGKAGLTETLNQNLTDILNVLNAENAGYSFGRFALNSDGSNIVLATPTYEGYQKGTDSIRLLATVNDIKLADPCEYKYLGFELSKDGGLTYKKFYTEFVYDSVLATDDGDQITYTAAALGGQYIYALIIEGISEATFDTLTVRTFAVDKNDNTLYGNAVDIALPANN